MSMYIDLDYLTFRIGADTMSASLHKHGLSASQTGSVLSRFISASCDYVNSYLEPTYTIPIQNPPENLKLMTADVCHRYILQYAHQPIPDWLEKDVRDATGMLFLIRDGKLSLPGATENRAGAVAGGAVFASYTGGAFSSLTGTFV